MNCSNNSKPAYGRGYVYNLRYHIVWCVKYRKPVIKGEIEEFIKNDIAATANALGFSVIALECMPDHLHLLISCTPQHYIPDLIKILKGNSARHLFMAHPEVKKLLWDGHLWNPSYFVSSVSDNCAEEIEKYIKSQKIK